MYFLVDFENVKSSGLRGAEYLEAGDYLTIFFSEAAHNCELRYLEAIEKSGCAFDTCRLKKTGKNALDFYIATRIGEFYGNGHKDQAAIISNDQGFTAVRDYWDARKKKIILAPSIERSLISSNINTERVKRLKQKLAGTDIAVFQAGYEERMKLMKHLRQIFGDGELAEKLMEIQDVLETGKTPKVIYLDSLHRFGRKQGLEIYRKIRPVLLEQA